MFVVLNQDLQGHPISGDGQLGDAGRRTLGASDTGCLEIGLVNNMPDAALRPTERQFSRLLAAAAGRHTVRLHFYSLDSIRRGDEARAYLRTTYGDLAELRSAGLDALIVTGCEPCAPHLSEEPYWQDLAGIVDWAEDNTTTTLWSCLAAHAAVLHMDGVERHRLADKRFGVLDCDVVSDSPLVAGIRSPFRVSHSRWNELRADELTAAGYRILTRSTAGDVDMFARERKSLFLFFQGHPEYTAYSLMGEYRRDVGRYLRGEMARYPATPLGYFDSKTEQRLAAFGEKAAGARDPALLEEFPGSGMLRPRSVRRLTTSGVAVIRNWLSSIATRKGEGAWAS